MTKKQTSIVTPALLLSIIPSELRESMMESAELYAELIKDLEGENSQETENKETKE